MAGIFKQIAAELRSLRRAAKGATTLESAPLVELLPARTGPAPLIGEILPASPAAATSPVQAVDPAAPFHPRLIDPSKRPRSGGILDQIEDEANAERVAQGKRPLTTGLIISPDDDPPGWMVNTEENYAKLWAAQRHADETGEPLVVPAMRRSRVSQPGNRLAGPGR